MTQSRHGPLPAPTADKLRRGITAPSKVNREAPLPRQRPPRAPRDMQPAARAVWQHVMAEMPPGLIMAVDEHALRLYCEAVVRYLNAQRIYQESTPLVRQGRYLAKNPLHQVVRDNAEQVRMWAHELGLTPAARAALRMDVTAVAPGISAEIGLPPRLAVIDRSA